MFLICMKWEMTLTFCLYCVKMTMAAAIDALIAYYNQVECEIHPVFDVYKFIQAMRNRF